MDSDLPELHAPGASPPPMAPPEATTADDIRLLRPFTSTPGDDLSESRSSISSMAVDDVPEGSEPLSAGPFNFQPQVMSTTPVKSVC